MKNLILIVVALVVIGGFGTYFYLNSQNVVSVDNETPVASNDGATGTEQDSTNEDEEADEVDLSETKAEREPVEVIGQSVDGEDIEVHHFGNGPTELLLVGGVHGGDAPNTAALAERFIEYFAENESVIPEDLAVTIIPTLNPDGLASGSRFNANNVDLNRNSSCDWAATSQWRDQQVSGGSEAFSEPEAAAIRDYARKMDIGAAVFWFAAEGKVYPSACEDTPSRDSVTLAATFANAAGYQAAAEFDAYQINGDLTNWLAGEGIDAISVLLTDRTSTEWEKNLAGVEKVLEALTSN